MTMNNTVILPPEVVTALNGNQNKIAIVAQLLSKKGQFIVLNVKKPLKLLSKYQKANIIGWKYSTMQVRCGVKYEALTSVMEKRAETNKPVEPLQGREWVLFPYVLRSTSANPKILFRFYNIDNNFKPKVKYVIDNYEVRKEDLPNYCLASEYKEHETPPCFDLSIDAIESIK